MSKTQIRFSLSGGIIGGKILKENKTYNFVHLDICKAFDDGSPIVVRKKNYLSITTKENMAAPP